MADPYASSPFTYSDDHFESLQPPKRSHGINIFGNSSGYYSPLMMSSSETAGEGGQQQHHNQHEMSNFGTAPTSVSGLGISMGSAPSQSQSQSPDPNQHHRLSSPETPHSFHNLMSGDTPRHTPSQGSFSPRIADSQGTPEPYSEIWAPSMPRSRGNSQTDPSATETAKQIPTAQEREIMPSSSSAQKLPKIVEPRHDEMDDEFDDEIFYKKFGKFRCPVYVSYAYIS